MFAHCVSLSAPEGALRLRPGKAGSAAPAGEEETPRSRNLCRSLSARALRLRPGEASSTALAGEEQGDPMLYFEWLP